MANLAPVGQYTQPKKVVAGKLAGMVSETYLDFNGIRFEQGETLDYTSARHVQGNDLGTISAGAFAGILVGTKTDDKGKKVAIFDRGKGRFGREPIEGLLLVSRSTAKVIPSTGTIREKWARRWNSLKIISTQFVAPAAAYATAKTVPVLTGVTAAGFVAWGAGNGIMHLYDQSTGGAIIAVGGTAGLVLTKPGRSILSAAWKVSYGTGKAMGHLGSFLVTLPFKAGSYIRSIKSIVGVLGIKLLDVTHRKDAKTGIGSFKYHGETDGVRLYISPSRTNPDPDFVEKVKKSYEDAVATKRYLVSLGMPDFKDGISSWVSEDGVRFLEGGPYAAPSLAYMYIGPLKISASNRKKMEKAGQKTGARFPKNEDLQKLVTAGDVYGHEMTHLMVYNFLGKDGNGAIAGPIDEALADYFPMSALNEKHPMMGDGAFVDGLPLREAVERQYSQEYPEHLNMNHLSQVSGDSHKSSQLILRMLWRVRDAVGARTLDPIIARTIPTLGPNRKAVSILFPLAPGYGSTHNVIDTLQNVYEMYLFAGSIYRVAEKSGNGKLQALILASAEEAGLPAAAVKNTAAAIESKLPAKKTEKPVLVSRRLR